MKNYIFLYVFLLCSCASSIEINENSSTLELENISIVNRYVKEDVYIKFNFIEDSIDLEMDCKSDSIYLAVWFYDEEQREVRRFYVFKNDTLGFTVPKNTSYIYAYFYNLCDSEEKRYIVHVTDKYGKPKKNTYTYFLDDSIFLKKELKNYPNNLTTYSNHIIKLSEKVYLGELDVVQLKDKAKQYLYTIKDKVSTEKPHDLEALAVLYAFSHDKKSAEGIINQLYNRFPNHKSLHNAYMAYFFSSMSFGTRDETQEAFEDSLVAKVARNYPQSPMGVLSTGEVNHKYYSDEDLLESVRIALKDRSPWGNEQTVINQLIKLNRIEEAERETWKYIENANNNAHIHASPISKTKEIVGAGKETYIGWGYQLLAQVNEAKKDYDKAFIYLDTAYNHYVRDKKNQFINYSFKKTLNYKATLQKNINQPSQALQTYETLYQKTKDDRVLDSIKVVFKETEQEKGFESYVKNLRERVESESREPKKLATNFSIKDMSGYEIKLSDWKERVVVLNFWANYCLPCAKEIPFLNELWRETQTDEIIFLSVTKNTPLEVTRFAQRQKEMFSFSVLPNAKELTDVYDVNLVPTTIVINKKGEIVHRESGFSGNIDKLKQVVLEELKK